jgi:hypothetical protein
MFDGTANSVMSKFIVKFGESSALQEVWLFRLRKLPTSDPTGAPYPIAVSL